MKIPKAKTEERAIGALSAIVNMHPTMRGQFYTMDSLVMGLSCKVR